MIESIEIVPQKDSFWKISKRERRLLIIFNIGCILPFVALWIFGSITKLLVGDFVSFFKDFFDLFAVPDFCIVYFIFISISVLVVTCIQKILFFVPHKKQSGMKMPVLLICSLFTTIILIYLLRYFIGIIYPPFVVVPGCDANGHCSF